MFSKELVLSFKKTISRKMLREIESEWQKIESHRNSNLYYNLTDRTGPGMPINFYSGDKRTPNMKIGHAVLCTYKGDNRTSAQKQHDIYVSSKLGTHCALISESKEIVYITSIRKFCKDYNLHRISIMNVINGKIKSYKGWALKQ